MKRLLRALVVVFLSTAPLAARETVQAPIVNGVTTAGLPAVGYMLLSNPAGIGSCTGTLIGCRTILTAAHCFCGTDTPGSLCSPSTAGSIFLPSGGVFTFSNVTIHPDYSFPQQDLAVVRLASAVTGIAPLHINQAGSVGTGLGGLAVGYGITSGDHPETGGIKRAGVATTLACPSPFQATNICAELHLPLGPPGEDSGICQGDSGGPLLFLAGEETVVGGVASGVTGNCEPPASNIWARVFQQRSWIMSVGGADLSSNRCGAGPQAGEVDAPITTAVSTINPGQVRNYTLEVPQGSTLLRVALTHTYNSDVDLRVRRGAPPTASQFDCESDNAPPFFDGCSLVNPTPGTWHFSAVGFQGSSIFQLTATTFEQGAQPTAPCVPGPKALCIDDSQGDKRFKIGVEFDPPAPDDPPRDADAISLSPLGVTKGGLLTFFNPTNPEMLVKVLRGCPVNGHFWVFYAATTNVEFTITVTDTQTGRVWTRTNPQGTAAVPVQDTEAFACN